MSSIATSRFVSARKTNKKHKSKVGEDPEIVPIIEYVEVFVPGLRTYHVLED
ncbi:hypothetical protein MKW98_000590, partial [Papaver atlanticum]